jgi:methionine biosynthesis protein MetW
VNEPVEWNSVHFLASLLVPPGAEVLDVGCGTGRLGAQLIGAGCSVVGIESDKEAVSVAEEAGLEVLIADLEEEGALEPLDDRRFDVALCMDVLEHLRDPAPVLRRVSQLVKPTGFVLISIPNMAHGAVRVAMLEGRVERTDHGLLDRTHLYLYDREAVEKLCRAAGVEILERLALRRQLDQTEIPVDADRVPDDVRALIDADADATVYQFLYVACADRSTVDWPRPHPAVEFIERSQMAEDAIRTSTAALQARLRDQDRELDAARAQLGAYEEQVRVLRAELEQVRRSGRRDREEVLDRLAADQAERADLLRRLHAEEDERFAAAAELESTKRERDRLAAELAGARPAADRWHALQRRPLVRIYRLMKRLLRALT